ncbi:MAG: hypothetical protein JWO86_3806, partial [Myxococcaceae bacterium]|nr:hypothetical protein [Myxococcaceae bacterium]
TMNLRSFLSARSCLPLLAGMFLACSSSSGADEAPSTATEAIAHKETHFDAKWKADTVVLDDTQIAAFLLDPSSEDGVYHFKPSPDLASKLTVGKVVLLTGVNVVRITQAESSADGITIHTEPAALADAAQSANLEFKLGGVLPVFVPTTDLKASSLPLDGPLIRPLGVSNITPDGKSASFQGTINGFGVGYKYTRAPSTLNAELTVDYAVGDGKLKVVGTAAVNAFDASGKIVVEDGATRDFDLDLDGLDITFSVDVGAVVTGKGLEKLKIPMQARVPFFVGPIPMYLGMGVEVEIESLVGPQSSMFFHTTCKAKGKTSLNYDGKTVRPTGSLDGIECTAQPKDYLAPTLNVGLGVRVELPKISLGVGLAGFSNIPIINKAVDNAAEVFVSYKHEAVGIIAIHREAAGPYPVITGTCFTLDVNEGIFAGGTLRIAGFEQKQETQLYGSRVLKKMVGAGKGCPQ